MVSLIKKRKLKTENNLYARVDKMLLNWVQFLPQKLQTIDAFKYYTR